MNASVTISGRSLVVALAVAAALLLAYLVGAVQTQAPAEAAAPVASSEVDPASPSIVMTGSGTATGVPDQLTFAVGVHAVATDVSSALRTANATTRRVLDAVEGEGVDQDDLKTTGLNIHANYDYSDDGPAVITGYTVSQNLSVLVRSLPDAGRTLSAAAAAGGNAVRLSDVHLQVDDTDALMADARDAAMAEARVKAEQYAEASGRSLGDVLLVRENGDGRQAQRALMESAYRAADSAALSSVPIRAGKAELQVDVSVVWSLA